MNDDQNNSIYRVSGGVPLSGEITPQGNKNEALPLLAAACLTDQPMTLENLPAIEDVAAMIEILRSLGVAVDSGASHSTVTVRAQSEPKSDLPPLSARSCAARSRWQVPCSPAPGGSFFPNPAATVSADDASIRT